MARRYLGYGITNENGTAKLSYLPDGTAIEYSYTGVGAGKVDIVAESGTLQSDSFELLDCMFYDDGVSTPHRSDYTTSELSVSYDSSGTVLSHSSSTTGSYTLNYAIDRDVCVEFDFKINARNGNNIRFFGGGANIYYSTAELVDNSFHHFKAEINDSTVNTSVDNVNIGELSRGSNTALRFVLANGCGITFKNLVVYQI